MGKISVIIPVYNIERYLCDCLDSILGQTYRNLEIILIDDGSKDSTGQICDRYAKKDDRIVVIHKDNAGVSAARNNGVTVASGEYISFVDGDDWIAPDMYETLYRNAIEYDADISCCGIEQVKQDGTISTLADGRVFSFNKEQLIKGFFDSPLVKETMYGPCNKIIRRELLVDHYFDTKFAIGEDLLFVFGCLERAETVILDNKPMYRYIKRDGSATTSTFSEKRLHYVEVADILCSRCQKKYLYAYPAAILWTYVHKIVILRNLNKYTLVKQANLDFYNNCMDFVEKHKKDVWKVLPLKRKIDYYIVHLVPWIYKLKII